MTDADFAAAMGGLLAAGLLVAFGLIPWVLS